MGRVSKYKKVKAIDPFAPLSRKKAYFAGVRAQGSLGRIANRKGAELYDLPAGGKDDFDMDEFGNIKGGDEDKSGGGGGDSDSSVLQNKKKKKKRNNEESRAKHMVLLGGRGAAPLRVGWTEDLSRPPDIFDVAFEQMGGKMKSLEKAIGKRSMVGAGMSSSAARQSAALKEKKVMFKSREEGESMRAFNRRIKNETGLALKEDIKDKQTPTLARRKEFLNNKKLKKKGKLPPRSSTNGDGDEAPSGDYFGNEATHRGSSRKKGATTTNSTAGDSDDSDDERRMPKDAVQFGEQALRPPEIRVVPKMRKLVHKEAAARNDGEKDSGGGGGDDEDDNDDEDDDEDMNNATHKKKKAKKNSTKDNACAMELLRQRVQESYKAMKAKKRGILGSHL